MKQVVICCVMVVFGWSLLLPFRAFGEVSPVEDVLYEEITTEPIAVGEADRIAKDFLQKTSSGNGTDAVDLYFDADTYLLLAFPDIRRTLSEMENGQLMQEFVRYIKLVASMPELKGTKHKIISESITEHGFSKVVYVDLYGTSLEQEHALIFRKVNGGLKYFDMHREDQSMPIMLREAYLKFSDRQTPRMTLIEFFKLINKGLERRIQKN